MRESRGLHQVSLRKESGTVRKNRAASGAAISKAGGDSTGGGGADG